MSPWEIFIVMLIKFEQYRSIEQTTRTQLILDQLDNKHVHLQFPFSINS